MHGLSARWAKLAGLLAVLALLVPLVTIRVAAQDAAGAKVLRVHHLVYPDDFDPQKSSFTNEIDILQLAYEGLTRLDKDGNTIPGAAESWEFNADGTVVTFTLREGLQYSDGSPVTAENYRYAIERTCDPNTAGEYPSILFDVKGCQEFVSLYGEDPENPLEVSDEDFEAARQAIGAKAVDDRTLEVTLNSAAAYFPTVAYTWVFYPVKQEIVEQDPDAWWQDSANHIGNGPYRITRIEEDQLIAFEPNENYWGEQPKLDGIEYIYQPESGVALEAYRAGDLDTMQVDPSQIPAIKDDPELGQQLLQYPQASTFNLQFNLTQEPWTDKKVREAFSLAFNRQEYCEQVRNGDCVGTTTWVPAGIPGALETEHFGFDPEAAKQALAESSYGGPEELPEISLYYNSDDAANTARAEYIAGMYRDNLEVEVTLEPTEGKALVDLRKDLSTWPHMTIAGWIQDYPDPQNWLSIYWSCQGFAVDFGYCNEEFDALVKQADAEPDATKRLQLYEQAHQLLIDDIPGPFLYNSASVFLVKPYVTGYVTSPNDSEWPGERVSAHLIDIER